MNILIVGDGPRDREALPVLVCKILGAEVATRFDVWRVRVRGEKGTIYARRVKYFTRRARAAGFAALAVVVDKDKAPAGEKLRQLRAGRDEDRQNNPCLPTALGEANPHFDVWLLDDEKAVRETLQLPREKNMPNPVRVTSPKQALSELIEEATEGRSELEKRPVSEIMGSIAERLEIGRCNHAGQTGFSAFVDDVRREIGPVVS